MSILGHLSSHDEMLSLWPDVKKAGPSVLVGLDVFLAAERGKISVPSLGKTSYSVAIGVADFPAS